MGKLTRVYSRPTRAALKLLGNLIGIERKMKRMSTTELSVRCGITRQTLSKIERGEPTVEIGSVFEAALIVGLPIFQMEDPRALNARLGDTKERMALLPKRIRKTKLVKPNDDF